MFPGLAFKVCPRIPEDFVYVDEAYEKGPRGALLRVTGE
jgi:hypothetical protein